MDCFRPHNLLMRKVQRFQQNNLHSNKIIYINKLPDTLKTSTICQWLQRIAYRIAGGNDSILPPIISFLLMDSVVVVLYEPELLSWYSASAVTATGISLFESSFFFNEFVLIVFTWLLECRKRFFFAASEGKKQRVLYYVQLQMAIALHIDI